MEDPARTVLRKKLGRIKDSSVDPAWLAGKLFSDGIIGAIDLGKASNDRELADKRRGDLVLTVMGNGAPDVFQTFVDILLSERHLKWLGEELKSDFIDAGGVWRKNPVPDLTDDFIAEGGKEPTKVESGPADVHSDKRKTKRGTTAHSTSSLDFTLQNILDVLDKVGFSAAYWRELGMRLKPDLDFGGIEADYTRVDRRLEEVIAKWKHGGDDPSWKALAEAVSLCKNGGGKNVAFHIEQEAGLV